MDDDKNVVELPPSGHQLFETVEGAARDGSKLDILRSMRLRLAAAFDDPDTSATALAAITIRVSDLTTEIESIEARDRKPAKGGVARGGNGGPKKKWESAAI